MTSELQKNSEISLPLSAESMTLLGFIYIGAKAEAKVTSLSRYVYREPNIVVHT